jgi:S-DNA-T family DNA segregation ATPase FtsK/SpoIIIE
MSVELLAIAVLAVAGLMLLGPILVILRVVCRVVRELAWLVRWLYASGVRRQRLGQAHRIEWKWRKTADALGLVQLRDRTNRHGELVRETVTPRIGARPESWGVRVHLSTLPRVGAHEYDKAADWLADEWGAEDVEVERVHAGRVELRAVYGDPLAEHRPFPWDNLAEVGWRLPIGHDPWGRPVAIPLRNHSGTKVAGLAGFGKTQLLTAWGALLAARPEAQLAIFDGKTRDPNLGDWAAFDRRAMFMVGDDPEHANAWLVELVELVKLRPELLRAERGTHRFWDDGPTVANPLVVVVLDEAHNYVDTAGLRGDAKAVIDANQRALRTLVKEGRGLGVLTIPATQKGTADALPTAIRDNLETGVCFATSTLEAAEAVLASGIRGDEANHPTRLRDKARYTGVCVVTGVPGLDGKYARVRVGDIDSLDVASIATTSADYRYDLADLMRGAARPPEAVTT